MHITINKNNLSYGKYKVKCALGKRGIGNKRREGDKITPHGLFKIKYVLFRKDRIKNLRTKLSKINIAKNMGWCDDPKSNKYNQLVYLPSKHSHEKLFRRDNIYDIILVLDYNMSPIKKNKGSAIFIHCSFSDNRNTMGCIALKKKDILILLKNLRSNTFIKI